MISPAAIEAKHALQDYLNSPAGRNRARYMAYQKSLAPRDWDEDPETEEEREERLENIETEVPQTWKA